MKELQEKRRKESQIHDDYEQKKPKKYWKSSIQPPLLIFMIQNQVCRVDIKKKTIQGNYWDMID